MDNETKYFDMWEEEVVDYETASNRVYDDMEWDLLEKHFIEGLRSGRYSINEFWYKLPEWMQNEIDEDAFNEAFNDRFDEIEEGEEE